MRPQNTNHLKFPGPSSKSPFFQSHEIFLRKRSVLLNSGLCQCYLSNSQDPSLDSQNSKLSFLYKCETVFGQI